MDCKEFERLIPEFINQEMDFRTLIRFREHIDRCDNCREELVIQFLVTEGIARLEEGDAFDLQNELDRRMEEADRKIRFHSSFLRAGLFMEVMAMLAILGVVLWIII